MEKSKYPTNRKYLMRLTRILTLKITNYIDYASMGKETKNNLVNMQKTNVY